MNVGRREIHTEAEYLARERESDVRHELVNGEIVAMAGGSAAHGQICANIIRSLGNRFADRPCVVYTSDVRVTVPATRLYTYPDVTVVCGKPEFHPNAPDTLCNPTVLVEVLSESTDKYDRGPKFAHYRKLPSLRHYLLVSLGQRRIECYSHDEGGVWTLIDVVGDGVALLPAVGVELPLSEVYLKVEMVESTAEGVGAWPEAR